MTASLSFFANNTMTNGLQKTRMSTLNWLKYEQKKELKRVENQIKKLETKKSDIEQKFNSTDLSTDDIQTFSTELGEINDSIEEKELRWFELSELAEE